MRYLEIRRHTDNDGDTLTAEGIMAAEAVGRTGLHPPYAPGDGVPVTQTADGFEVTRLG
jgi:hypothetical protein